MWRPKVTAPEAGHLKQVPLAQLILKEAPLDSDGHLPVRPCGDLHGCVFFNPQDNTCGVYMARPFECRLYPFILTRQQSAAAVCVHLNCPHVQETRQQRAFDDYVAYLRGYFAKQTTRDFLKSNATIVGDYRAYQDELECLFTIPL